MCTALMMQSFQGECYFGRTMDFSYPLQPELFVVPRGYEWNNLLNTHTIKNSYQYMGIGQELSSIVFAEGLNEKGFAAAALYFPDYAQYDPIDTASSCKTMIAAIELVGYLLGLSSSVKEAVSLLQSVSIVGVKDSVTNSVAPLHWMAADQSGSCMVIEKTIHGLLCMENPVGVLSNSPDFQWHITNLRNYMNVTPFQHQEKVWPPNQLTPFGQGAGAFGLPGDFTPPSRFVRTAFQKSFTPLPVKKEEAVVTCFHILEGVSIPKGAVMTSRGTPDYTQYTAMLDLSAKEYFFKTYDNSQIAAFKLPDIFTGSASPVSFGKLVRPVAFEAFAEGEYCDVL